MELTTATQHTYSLRYPRRVITRPALNLLGRIVLDTLTRTTINGKENLPKDGPLILVGNHVDMLEVLLMTVKNPYLVEMIGADDVPMVNPLLPFIRLYGYIPIKRGSMDRHAMNMARDVLLQGGVIGLFPEGGIWEPNLKQAHTGVAWLSSKANAPILPMGFGGTENAVRRVLSLKRPRVTMNIGEVIPPITDRIPGKSRKDALTEGAEYVMAQISSLVPAEEKARWSEYENEEFELSMEVYDSLSGKPVEIPANLRIRHGQALAKFFLRPIILQTLARNLRLPVNALQRLDNRPSPHDIASAAQVVLDYIEYDNPPYLTYRFGGTEGNAMQQGIAQLRDIALWAAQRGYSITIRPIRRVSAQN